jgi:hypothetical protein
MIYYRCKCGLHEAWGSMPPPRCLECEKCETTLASDSLSHGRAEPHEFSTQGVETNEGMKGLDVCVWCGKSRRELEVKP